MQRPLWFLGLAMVVAGGLWAFQSDRQNAPRSWEYAIVEGWHANSGSQTPEGDHFRSEFHGRVAICYVEVSGCRSEEVEVTPSYPWFKNQENPNRFADAQQAAVAKAVALLGSAGWELVGPGPDPTRITDPNHADAPVALALYFKRSKQ